MEYIVVGFDACHGPTIVRLIEYGLSLGFLCCDVPVPLPMYSPSSEALHCSNYLLRTFEIVDLTLSVASIYLYCLQIHPPHP